MELTGRRRADALAVYRTEHLATRVRAWGRWTTAPFPAVESLVPEVGDVLEVGCGIGLVAVDLGRTGPGRRVLAVDVDPVRAEVARRAAARAGVDDRVRVEVVPPDWAPAPESADAVVVVDVLYLLGRTDALELLDRLVAALRPGGVLVVKEMAARPRWKAAWTRAQETVAVRGLRVTAGRTVELVPVEDLAAHLAARGLAVRTVPMDRGHLHPHMAVVALRTEGRTK
ncbi:MAG: methyltransferase domain-containing protein [Actinomycetes bacterium]